MPRPTNENLRDMLSKCTHDLATLAQDEEWSGQVPVIIPRALPIYSRDFAESARYVVVITFDLRSLRDPGAIRRALGTRDPGVLTRVRWSHTEALMILATDPAEYCQRLAPILDNAGLHASLFFTTYSGHIQSDYDRAVHNFPAHTVGRGVYNETQQS